MLVSLHSVSCGNAWDNGRTKWVRVEVWIPHRLPFKQNALSFGDGFIEHCLNRGVLRTGSDMIYTLPDLAAWLQMKSQVKRLSS